MSATLRYARILNGFSPLISRRSAISERMTAMAALSNPETFRLDVKVEDACTTLLQCRRDGRLTVGRSVAEQAPAAAGAADLRGGGARDARPAHEIVDFRRRDARREPFPVIPFGGDLTADFVPVAPLERVTHRHGRIANPFERIEDVAVAVQMSLDDFPVVRARVPRRTGIGEDEAGFEGASVHVETHPVNTAHAELDGGDAAVERRPVVLNAR